MIRRIKHMLTDNIGLKVLALVIACIIWFSVSSTNDPMRTMLIYNVPITLLNESSIADIGKVVQPEGSGTVTIKVKERKSVINSLSRNGSDFTVTADLQSITELSTVPLSVTCSNSSVTWDEIEVSPSSLKVTLEDKVEQAFTITVTSSGAASSGYALGTTEIQEGRNILLAGPASLINIIDHVTAPINIQGLSRDTALTSVLEVYDKNGASFTDSQLSLLEFKTSEGVEITDRIVNVNVDMWKVASDIRLVVNTDGEPEQGYVVSNITTIPETISLTGTDEALASLGGELILNDAVTVEGLSDNAEYELSLNDTISELDGIRMLADTDPAVTVEVQIEKSGDWTVEYPMSELELENAPTDKKLVFTPADRLSIGVHADEYADRLTHDDIQAAVDLSECTEDGIYELPVIITLPDGYNLSGEVTVKVSVSTIETEAMTEE